MTERLRRKLESLTEEERQKVAEYVDFLIQNEEKKKQNSKSGESQNDASKNAKPSGTES